MNFIEKIIDNYYSKIENEKSKLEITSENYMGYVELFKFEYLNDKQNKILKKFMSVHFPITIVLVIAGLLTFPPISLIVLGIAGTYFLTNFIINLIKLEKIETKRKKELISNYPYVDVEIDSRELRRSLEKVGLISKKTDDGMHYYYDLDIDSYQEKLFSLNQWESSNMQLPKHMEESISKKLNESFSNQVNDDVMKKSKEDTLDRSELEDEEEFNPTKEFINETVKNYQKLLKLGLISSCWDSAKEMDKQQEETLLKQSTNNSFDLEKESVLKKVK